ncbi:MAG: chloride channel protein, partial [Bilophila sp.]
MARQLHPAIRAALFRGAVIGVCTGALIGLFRLSHERVAALVATFVPSTESTGAVFVVHGVLWLGALVLFARVLDKLVRAEPLIAGSGIPQTELTLAGTLPLPWLRVLLYKFAGSWLALVAGLSLGREG